MTWELLFALAAITYASRGLALVVLPPLPYGVRMVLDRMPPALFAGLAASSMVIAGSGPGGGFGLAGVETLVAAAAALAVAPRRSLPLCLIAGIGAYLVASALL